MPPFCEKHKRFWEHNEQSLRRELHCPDCTAEAKASSSLAGPGTQDTQLRQMCETIRAFLHGDDTRADQLRGWLGLTTDSVAVRAVMGSAEACADCGCREAARVNALAGPGTADSLRQHLETLVLHWRELAQKEIMEWRDRPSMSERSLVHVVCANEIEDALRAAALPATPESQKLNQAAREPAAFGRTSTDDSSAGNAAERRREHDAAEARDPQTGALQPPLRTREGTGQEADQRPLDSIVYIVMQKCLEHAGCGEVPVSVHATLAQAQSRVEQEQRYSRPERFSFSWTTAMYEAAAALPAAPSESK